MRSPETRRTADSNFYDKSQIKGDGICNNRFNHFIAKFPGKCISEIIVKIGQFGEDKDKS